LREPDTKSQLYLLTEVIWHRLEKRPFFSWGPF
jgi:hypothetical protein